jgi:adenylate cyclase
MFSIYRELASVSHVYVKWVVLLLIGLAASVQLLRDPLATENYSGYDQMIKRRLWTAAVDPKIIIVDIDEASLSQLNSEFGRWPWPRETLAAALEWLESKGSQAVVFDILFSDLDITHPQSDQAFADTVSQSSRSFFPILRLNPDNDGISQIRADQLPGFAQAMVNTPPPTLALVPPVFDAVIQTQRLGYHNIYPDRDGINRHYDLWQDKEGWRLWSLPARLANSFGWDKGEKSRVLINFNHAPNAYPTVPFREIWRLSQSREGLAADPRFEGAVVLIGSTASSLFDVKATPISSIHPGVHVLANVIDNIKHGHFIQELPHGFKFFSVWTCLFLMGIASGRMKTQVLRWSVLVIPTILLAISYLSLHISDWFVDLSGSASHALLFFSVMSVYQNWRLNHFAETRPMVESLLGQTSAPLYAACWVASYAPDHIKPQRLITHAAASGSQVAVVQAGWYGEFVGDQSGPSCVLLVNHNKDALTHSLQALIKKETPFFLNHDVSEITQLHPDNISASHEDSQRLWGAVAKALIKWENLQN